MEEILFDHIAKYMVLSEEEKRVIIGLDIFRTYKKGAVLLKQGQLSTDGYFVIKGCLRCYYVLDGDEKTTAFYTEAESLNPPCTINKQPSAFYVACLEDSIVIVADTKMESVIFEKFPRFETLCRILSEKLLADNQASFDGFRLSSPEERYLDLIGKRPGLLQRVPQYQIASYLGITPQSLSRMRSRLVKKPR